MLQYSTEKIYGILKDFYTLTKIRIVLIDSDFNGLLSYPEDQAGFCGLIRKNLEENAKCVTSDRNGCLKCAATRDLILYHCHAGLMEAVVPIEDKGGVIGYIMFGQILPREGYEKAKKKLKERYPEGRFHGITEAIEAIQVKSPAELNAAATVLQALTSYVLSNSWVAPGRAEFIRRLDQYIEDHMQHAITVRDICASLGIARTRLYQVADSYLGCGIAEYVRGKRIWYAQQLLESSRLPINEIAYKTGFSDYTHFSRTFKKEVGMSARQYRERYLT